MPCALTSGADYPDYLKRILRTIDVGNNTALKTCACSLRTPVDNEGCPIIGEDGKIGSFPFCLPIGTPTPGQNLQYLELTLKQAMTLFWKVKTWEGRLSGSVKNNGGPNYDDFSYNYLDGGYVEFSNLYAPYFPPNFTQEKLVCPFLTSDFRGFIGDQRVNFSYQPNPIVINNYLGYSFNSEDMGAIIGENGSVYAVLDLQSYLLSNGNINGYYAGQCDLSFEGYNGSFPMYTLDGNTISANISMSIRAKEYWP